MRLEYDAEADAAYLRLRTATVASTEEIAPGVLMDLAADGRPVAASRSSSASTDKPNHRPARRFASGSRRLNWSGGFWPSTSLKRSPQSIQPDSRTVPRPVAL